ncbi:RlpA-like double-psi beta-barrel domain-containing protein [Sporobolomyces koalae]|uniref:RlpA-like double-psi beta-barrel domain-containing protein n=1 Tax=Sporobolomyces koalae TaxID=500713 RepID=UPI0031756F55
MRSFAALSALAVPALALSYSHGDPRMAKRHHQMAEHALEQRDQVAAPSSGRMARKIKRGEVSAKASKQQTQTYTTTAIWYAETGWIGSCGVEFNDNDLVIGLPLELYPNPAEKSELCGQSVVVTNPKTGQSITAVVADASQRDAYTTFPKGAYQALGGDLDVGELSVSYHFANADSISGSLPSAFSTSATGKEKSAVKTSASAPQTPAGSSSKAYDSAKGNVQAAAAPKTEAPQVTTSAPATPTTPAYDSASAAAASSKAQAEADAAAYASSSSAEADKLWASSSSAAAAAQSAKAQAQADADAAAAAASSKAAAEAAAASKSAADAAWAASSSKSAAAAAATSAANNNGGGGGSGKTYTGGIATFFYQNGVAGNCGQVNSDSTLLVALPTATYDNGSHCGKYVTITRSDTGKQINALVADSCPTCNNNACLDLSWGAFSALGGTQDMGVFDITWQFDN